MGGGIICPPPPDGVILRPPSSARVNVFWRLEAFRSFSASNFNKLWNIWILGLVSEYLALNIESFAIVIINSVMQLLFPNVGKNHTDKSMSSVKLYLSNKCNFIS